MLVFDHALREQVGERLVEIHKPQVAGDARPETRVQQVQDGVLDAADILVHRHEAPGRLLRKRQRVVFRVGVAQKIPARTGEGVHGVGLAVRRPSALRAAALVELGHVAQGLAVGDAQVARQLDGQVLLGLGHDAACVAIDHGDGVAPITLARDKPIAQTEVDRGLAAAALFKPRCDGRRALTALAAAHAGELSGLHHDARLVAGRIPLHVLDDAPLFTRQTLEQRIAVAHDHGHDGQAVLARELEIALVARRHSHDSTGAVAGQDVVGHPHGHLVAVDRVEHVAPREGAVLVARATRALHRRGRLGRRAHLLAADLVLGARHEALHQLVLGGQQKERAPEQRVWPRGEDGDGLVGGLAIGVAQGEVHMRALGAANPVGLHLLHPRRPPLQPVQAVEQLLRVVGDLQVPLVELAVLHLAVAAPAFTLFDLLVCQHCLAAGTPVHGVGLAIGQPALVHLDEEPLAPAVVLGICRDDLAVPIVGQTHLLERGLLCRDVGVCPLRGLRVVLDGGVFGRQPEGVPADGMKHLVAAHVQVARVDVADGVVAHVPHVQIAAGVGKHLEHVLGLARGVGVHMIEVGLLPGLLPLGLDVLGTVLVLAHRVLLPVASCVLAGEEDAESACAPHRIIHDDTATPAPRRARMRRTARRSRTGSPVRRGERRWRSCARPSFPRRRARPR